MYVQHVHTHEAAASQPIFSRAVQPAQRKVPLIERRKRKVPAALNLEQIPKFRRRNPKHACVLTAPPTCIRVAKAEAGPHHTLHRCVDVRTQEVFFHPEYTGPAGEEDKHALQWPKVIELSSPVARSGAETLRHAGYISSDTTDITREDYLEVTPGSVYNRNCGQQQEQEQTQQAASSVPSLIERRKCKAPAPLQLEIIPPFTRRNAQQICVLDAPATHVRLHAVQAGPHHLMHKCIDAHTEEIFFMPEYVGPSGQQDAHKVAWPQIINPAPKLAEHQQDVSFADTLDRASSAKDMTNLAATNMKQQSVAGPSAVSLASDAVSAPGSILSSASPLADGSGATSTASTATTVNCISTATFTTSSTSTTCTSKRATSDTRTYTLPIAAVCCQAKGGADGGKVAAEVDTHSSNSTSATNSNMGGAIVEMLGGQIRCSPGTPCDVAVATASLAARAAVKVN